MQVLIDLTKKHRHARLSGFGAFGLGIVAALAIAIAARLVFPEQL